MLSPEDITLLGISTSKVDYINMLLKHAYQRGQASMMKEEEEENIV